MIVTVVIVTGTAMAYIGVVFLRCVRYLRGCGGWLLISENNEWTNVYNNNNNNKNKKSRHRCQQKSFLTPRSVEKRLLLLFSPPTRPSPHYHGLYLTVPTNQNYNDDTDRSIRCETFNEWNNDVHTHIRKRT
jgi:hypothetical protein